MHGPERNYEVIVYAVLSQAVKTKKRALTALFYEPRNAVEEMNRLNTRVNNSAFKGKFYYFTDGLEAVVQDDKVYGLFKGPYFANATELISLRHGMRSAHETAKIYNAAAERRGNAMIDNDRFYVRMLDIK